MIGIKSLENDFALKVFEGVSIPYLSKTEGKKKTEITSHWETTHLQHRTSNSNYLMIFTWWLISLRSDFMHDNKDDSQNKTSA